MEFPEKEIYAELIAEIKAKAYYFTSLAHPVPAHYDWDRGQYEDDGDKKEYPFNRPAIFFKFDDMDYEDRGGLSKRGTIPLTVTCVQDKYVDAMDGAVNQSDYLKLLEWKYLVHRIFNKFSGDCFGPLQMVTIGTDHQNRNLHVEYIKYEVKGNLMDVTIPEED